MKSFLINFFGFSIISVKPVLLGMKGRIRHFLLWLLCRGEVIPFGTDQTGKDIARRTFCKYCIKVMEGEALYYLRQLEKQ